jgi:hypothetical protein
MPVPMRHNMWQKPLLTPGISGSISLANRTMPDQLQEQVAKIWSRALGVKKIGPDDNFFALGGHSLLGVKTIAEIQATVGIEEELKLADLLEFPTLGAFCAHLEGLMVPSEETGSI